MGYMPESDAFIAGMTGVRFVRLMGELSGLPSEQALERAHEALFYVGLGEARYRDVDTYSLGMKQVAKLAQALVHGPRLLFLDEPTNGLDPPARERMLRLIRDIRDPARSHVILSSHLLRDVEECCDEVLVLKHGDDRHLLQPRGGAARQPQVPRAGGARRRRRAAFAAAVEAPGLRDAPVQRQAAPEARAAGGRRDPRSLPARRRAAGADPPPRLQARLAGGHLPQGDGEEARPWPSMSSNYGRYDGRADAGAGRAS